MEEDRQGLIPDRLLVSRVDGLSSHARDIREMAQRRERHFVDQTRADDLVANVTWLLKHNAKPRTTSSITTMGPRRTSSIATNWWD